MSIRHVGQVKRVTRRPDCVEIRAEFPDRPRTFYVDPTNHNIGPCVIVVFVAGHVGPVRTGPREGPFVELSPPRTRRKAPDDGVTRKTGPAVVQSSPIHQTIARPGSPVFASRPHPCTMQTMNQMVVANALAQILDKAGVSGDKMDGYKDAARRLWDMMDPGIPETDPGLDALVTSYLKRKDSGLNRDVLMRIARVVAKLRRRSREICG